MQPVGILPYDRILLLPTTSNVMDISQHRALFDADLSHTDSSELSITVSWLTILPAHVLEKGSMQSRMVVK